MLRRLEFWLHWALSVSLLCRRRHGSDTSEPREAMRLVLNLTLLHGPGQFCPWQRGDPLPCYTYLLHLSFFNQTCVKPCTDLFKCHFTTTTYPQTLFTDKLTEFCIYIVEKTPFELTIWGPECTKKHQKASQVFHLHVIPTPHYNQDPKAAQKQIACRWTSFVTSCKHATTSKSNVWTCVVFAH